MIRAEELTSIATTLRQRSQNQRAVLDEYFKAGGSLTSAEALNKLGIFACSQRVGEMRRDGYPIISEWVNMESGARVKRWRYAIQTALPL